VLDPRPSLFRHPLQHEAQGPQVHPPNGTSSRTLPHYYFRDVALPRSDGLSLRGSHNTCPRYYRTVRPKGPENPYGSGAGLCDLLPPGFFSEVPLIASRNDLLRFLASSVATWRCWTS
jgi:hypothetical protein